jgi:hypothetical protein
MTDFAAAALDPADPLLRAEPAPDGTPQASESEAATADTVVAAMTVLQFVQGDGVQTNALATLHPQMAEILVYLLWIGLFIPDVKIDLRKKRRTQTPRGWRRKHHDPS